MNDGIGNADGRETVTELLMFTNERVQGICRMAARATNRTDLLRLDRMTAAAFTAVLHRLAAEGVAAGILQPAVEAIWMRAQILGLSWQSSIRSSFDIRDSIH